MTVAFYPLPTHRYAQLRLADKGYEPDPWSNDPTFTYPQAPNARKWEHPPGAGRGPPSSNDDGDDDGTGLSSSSSSSRSPPKGGVAVAFKILGPKAPGDSSLGSVAEQLAYAVDAPGSNMRSNGRHLRHVAPSTLRVAGGGLLEPATILSRWVSANTLILVAQVLASCGAGFLCLSVVGYRLAVARKKKRLQKQVERVGDENAELPVAKGAALVATPFTGSSSSSGDGSCDPAESLAAAAWASAMGWLEGQIMNPQEPQQSEGSCGYGVGLDKKSAGVPKEGRCRVDPVTALECKLHGAPNNKTTATTQSTSSTSSSRRSAVNNTSRADWNYGGDWRPSTAEAESASSDEEDTTESSSEDDDDTERPSSGRALRSRRGRSRTEAREALLAPHAGGGFQGGGWWWLPSLNALGRTSSSTDLPITTRSTTGGRSNDETASSSSSTSRSSEPVTPVAPEAVSVVRAMPSPGLRSSSSCPTMTTTMVNMEELNALADQLASAIPSSSRSRDDAMTNTSARSPPHTTVSFLHASAEHSPAAPPQTTHAFMSRKARAQRRTGRGASREVELAEMGCVESSTRSPFHEDTAQTAGSTIDFDGDGTPTTVGTAASAVAAHVDFKGDKTCAISSSTTVLAGALLPFHEDDYARRRGLSHLGDAPEARI